MLRPQARHDTVVDDDSIFVEQQSAAGLSRIQVRHRPHVHEIQKVRGVGAIDLELAER
jgi:hypothetical protein